MKFPPYLDGKLLFTSYSSSPLQAATVDDSGHVTRVEQVLTPRNELSFIFRSKTGPDGAIYIARGEDQYGTAPTTQSRIVKLSYVGSCAPVVVAVQAAPPRPAPAARTLINHLGGDSRFYWPGGANVVRAYGVDGALKWESRRSAITFEGWVPASVPCGLLQLRFSQD